MAFQGLKRTPQAIVLAHRMDPERRELYVEGVEDQIRIKWIVGNSVSPNARILPVDLIEIPGSSVGGNKARLIAFARAVEAEGLNILCFVDADTDRLSNITHPSNVVLTDFRDMEGYWLRESCLEKVIMLALTEPKFNARNMLSRILSIGRILAALRLVSDEQGLQLPFQKTNPLKSLSCSPGEMNLEFDLERYTGHLLQKAGLSLSERDRLVASVERKLEAIESIPDLELVHGKDAIHLLENILFANGVARDDAFRILATSFERTYTSEHPNLMKVVDFLQG